MKEHHSYSEHNYQNNVGRGDSGHFSLSRADMHVQLPLIVGLVALILLSVFVSKDA
ncbi:MAG: hypothetical protein IH840_13055 [Candidatus Heimdallarchaeota archaeon]|nr:hypothetical protein [Candidatus Heimdallarchaeota archaeon]